MPLLTLVMVCVVMGVSTSNSHEENIETLLDNVLVLRVPQIEGSRANVWLTCGDAHQNTPVLWKKNGMNFPGAESENRIQIVVEEMQGGNFSCHDAQTGEYLNHTLVLVQLDQDNRKAILEEKAPGHGYIHCSAPNYEGSFHCTWTREQHRSKATVLLVKAQRFTETISCVLDDDGSGVRCNEPSCLYKEEQHRISLTVYIHSFSRLEAYTKTFYLREIVKPGMLPNLHTEDGKAFTWDYPVFWSKPCSFYGLQFQVKVVHIGRSCDTEEHIVLTNTDEPKYEVRVKTNRYVFCIRAQDKYTQGLWSHWSHCIVKRNNIAC